jgi:hypothetical protein
MTNFMGMSPEELEQVMASSTYPEAQGNIQLQKLLAESLRGSSPEGRQAGRTYVAANPLEHIASLLNTQRSNRMLRDVTEQQKALVGELRRARGTYARKFMTPPINGSVGSGQTTNFEDGSY